MFILASSYPRYRYRVLLLLACLVFAVFTHSLTTAQSRDPFVDCDVVTTMEQGDCDALVAIYNSTNGENWTNNDGWLVTDLPCTWQGVTCEGNRVKSLQLQNNNLVGTLPNAISNLDMATLINLSNNNLTGSLPFSIPGLDNIEVFNLSNNGLSGGIPPEFGLLTSLKVLALDNNALTGTIPPDLGYLIELKTLRLNNNLLSGDIPPELGNLTELEELWLQDNDLSGDLPGDLGNLTSLKTLVVSANSLDGTLPTQLGNLTELQRLAIDRNKFEGDFPPALALPWINNLDVGYNMLTAFDQAAIAFLDAKDADWRETQTVAPNDLSATFNPTTGILTFAWTKIPYTHNGGYYTIGCDNTEDGNFTGLQMQTVDKTTSEISFSGLPIATYYCAVNTFTPANAHNSNDLTARFSGPTTVEVTTQPAPTNDNVNTPLVISNEPYQLFQGNFDSATPDGANTPPLLPGCTNADLTNAPSVYFAIPATTSQFASTLYTPRGGPGYFPRGFAVVNVGGPGHFVRQPDSTDTVVALYRQNPDNSLTMVTCNDDIDSETPASSIGFQRYSEFTYYVAVWTKNNASTVVIQAKIAEKVFNGSFNQDIDNDKKPDGWKTGDGKLKVKCQKPEKAHSAPCMLQIKGTGAKAKIKQVLDYPAGFAKGDTLTLSAYMSRKAIVTGGKLMLKIRYDDTSLGNNGKGKATIEIPVGNSSDYEQFLTPSITLEGTIYKAIVQLNYRGVSGRLRIDDIKLLTSGIPAALLPLPVSSTSAAALPLPVAAP